MLKKGASGELPVLGSEPVDKSYWIQHSVDSCAVAAKVDVKSDRSIGLCSDGPGTQTLLRLGSRAGEIPWF